LSKDLSEIQRYELKYTITETLAAEIREHITNICKLDKHVRPGESGYIVNNLYFDTYDLKFYYDTKFRKLTRYKVRARFYGEQATDFIWPEIKYRHGSVIWKMRYNIPIDCWPMLFCPQKAERKPSLIKKHLDSFDDLIFWYDAQPMLHVRYFREPYVTELEEYGRITFDRQLCCRAMEGSIDLAYQERDMLYYDDPINAKDPDSPVILEIKVETFVPRWAIELIHKFNLTHRGFSKYCYGIDCILGYNDNGRISIFNYE